MIDEEKLASTDSNTARVDALADEFERALRSGHSPRIEDFLNQIGEGVRSAALWELLKVEVEIRRGRSESVRADEYLDRFPGLESVVHDVCNRSDVVLASAIDGNHPASGRKGFAPLSYDGDQTVDHMPSFTESQGLRIRCPHCSNFVEIATDTPSVEISCPTCGNAFRLASEELLSRRNRSKSQIGHFKLLERLGCGAFGAVWKALDTQLDRLVAIKLPRRGELTLNETELFLKEARAAAQLKHRNIVAVHEVGRHVTEHEDTVYIVSDLITGLSLDKWIEGQQLTNIEASRLVVTLAEALEHAHQRGVIHRDLKPQNILIDASGEPHITDFGLAKREAGEITMTIEGQIVGTPAYMSPEQAQGEGHLADRTSDIYSLGVILFQLLTQELPFRGSVRMLIEQVIHEEPPSPRQFRSSIPKDLETITLKCLEKDRHKRYASAVALQLDLLRFLNREPILARPIGQLERGWRFCRRHSVATSFSLALLLTFLSGFVAVTWQWRKTVAAQSERTAAQLNGLLTAASSAVPEHIANLSPYRNELITRLRELLVSDTVPEEQKLRIRLLLLPVDKSQIAELLASASEVDFFEFRLVRDNLLPYHKMFESGLWEKLSVTQQTDPADQFRILLFLAGIPDVGPKWSQHSKFVAEEFINTVRSDPRQYGVIIDMLRPVRNEMLPTLFAVYANPQYPLPDRQIATNALCEFAEVSSGEAERDANTVSLCDAILAAEPWQYSVVLSAIRRKSPSDGIKCLRTQVEVATRQLKTQADGDRQAKRVANAALGLVALGDDKFAWETLGTKDGQSSRCFFVCRYTNIAAPVDLLLSQLGRETNIAVKRAIVQCVGETPGAQLQKETFDALHKLLVQIFRNDPDPGMHAATRWTLTQLDADNVASLEASLKSQIASSLNDKDWYVNSAGHTMLLFGPCEFDMGSPPTEKERYAEVESLHRRRIERRFAISMLETTNAQFLKITNITIPPGNDCSAEDCPVHAVSWLQAAEYCNLLSKHEGIPEDQWCYVRNQTTGELDAADNALHRSGYRLPTEAEWEYVCRAGTTTARCFGQTDELLADYAWCLTNSPKGSKKPVGRLKPNDFGFFDIYGNAIEWCHDSFRLYPTQSGRVTFDGDPSPFVSVRDSAAAHGLRVLRGSAAGDADGFRSALRDRAPHDQPGANAIGFRVAKTIVADN